MVGTFDQHPDLKSERNGFAGLLAPVFVSDHPDKQSVRHQLNPCCYCFPRICCNCNPLPLICCAVSIFLSLPFNIVASWSVPKFEWFDRLECVVTLGDERKEGAGDSNFSQEMITRYGTHVSLALFPCLSVRVAFHTCTLRVWRVHRDTQKNSKNQTVTSSPNKQSPSVIPITDNLPLHFSCPQITVSQTLRLR